MPNNCLISWHAQLYTFQKPNGNDLKSIAQFTLVSRVPPHPPTPPPKHPLSTPHTTTTHLPPRHPPFHHYRRHKHTHQHFSHWYCYACDHFSRLTCQPQMITGFFHGDHHFIQWHELTGWCCIQYINNNKIETLKLRFE